ncbi:Uncharacterized protein involved in tolerance to divalent cations [Nonomuraea solani]|uniref:Uncharacterized protein involved in tolerance to divalent cations n=1 Tax=Nonomuraea solani TaxID=1144553 RepID=A0A1H6EJB5_9ACTN|nr:divalent cation tolerance protein CutA [Nonomuraea solani]SEG96949.1 Uncharacterized protein involved in tolerance to divalent cations [Nonomuraea solani]
MAELIEVHTTVEGQEKAADLAHDILRAGLAASIDLSPVTRLVRWETGVEETGAWKVAALTVDTRLPALRQRIERAHGDAVVPPILTFPVTTGSEAYLEWLHNEIDLS